MGDYYFRVLCPHSVTTHRRASLRDHADERKLPNFMGVIIKNCKKRNRLWKILKEDLSAMQMIQKNNSVLNFCRCTCMYWVCLSVCFNDFYSNSCFFLLVFLLFDHFVVVRFSKSSLHSISFVLLAAWCFLRFVSCLRSIINSLSPLLFHLPSRMINCIRSPFFYNYYYVYAL